MELTKEEKADLERQRCEAKVRCKEVWTTLQQLNRIAKTYLDDWDRWNDRFEVADRKLAEVDGRLSVDNIDGRKKKDIKLTKEQVTMITAMLEKEMEGGEEDGVS